jgi:hypothetical protein
MIMEPLRVQDLRRPSTLVAWLNGLLQMTRAARNVTGGPGVTILKDPGGTGIYVQPSGEGEGATGLEVQGDPVVLAQTQGTEDTDDYDREEDGKPVEFQVLTDVKYDPTTHKLTFRTRTITATGITSVSAESALIEITTAVECPCVEA